MSTKTTFKRIALVAVAALGFGMLSVVPSNAALIGQALTIDAAADAITLSGTSSDTATAYVTSTFTATAAYDSITVTGNMVSASTTSLLKIEAYDSGTSSSTVFGIVTDATVNDNVAAIGTTSASAGVVTATFAVSLHQITAAGTYSVLLYATPYTATGAGTPYATTVTWTVTVTGQDTKATGASTSTMRDGSAALATGTAEGTDSTVLESKSISAAQAANIYVTQRNATGTANESMTVVVDGPAWITTGTSAAGSRPTEGTVATLKNGNFIHVWSNGTGGTATITIKTLSGGFTATETVKFHGGAVSMSVTTTTYTILRAGGYATAGAVRVTPIDALGLAVKGRTITATPANTGIIASGSCSDAVGYVTDGVYLCSVSSAAGAVSGNSGDITFSVPDPLSTTGGTFTATKTFTVGGSVATEVISFHDDTLALKSTFTPGEGMVVAITAKDSSGNPVYDGAASPALTANKVLGGTGSVAASTYTGGLTTTRTLSSGVVLRAYNIYAPAATGTFMLTGLSGNASASLITASATVSDDSSTAAAKAASDVAQAAVDAAAEATDAANAATDAANAAAEAADAATAAAQDAADAVAALSAQVASLISSLKAQLTSLTNLVIKIQKKVKA